MGWFSRGNPVPEPPGPVTPAKRGDVPETVSDKRWSGFLRGTTEALNALPDEGARWAENANRSASQARWS